MAGEKPIRTDVASRYSEWLQTQMTARGWDQAYLARRANVPKQTVNTIVKGQSRQPTAQQVAAFSGAFEIEPAEMLEALGLWARVPVRTTPTPAELTAVYRDLGFPARRTLLQMGHALRELQAEYGRMAGRETAEEEAERFGLKPAAIDMDIQPLPDWPPPEGEVE